MIVDEDGWPDFDAMNAREMAIAMREYTERTGKPVTIGMMLQPRPLPGRKTTVGDEVREGEV